MNTKPRTRVALVAALVAIAGIAGVRQDDVQAETADASTACSTGNGQNALTIALPRESSKQVEGVYIRRAGCKQWSDNMGAISPGKSLHIFNLDDGDFEVYWSERPHTFGSKPSMMNAPPSVEEWGSAHSKRQMSLGGASHRRILL